MCFVHRNDLRRFVRGFARTSLFRVKARILQRLRWEAGWNNSRSPFHGRFNCSEAAGKNKLEKRSSFLPNTVSANGEMVYFGGKHFTEQRLFPLTKETSCIDDLTTGSYTDVSNDSDILFAEIGKHIVR